jgi:hypothetical protein
MIAMHERPQAIAVHEPSYGTTRTSRDVRAMSVMEGTSEVKYSPRVFRMLTQRGLYRDPKKKVGE